MYHEMIVKLNFIMGGGGAVGYTVVVLK